MLNSDASDWNYYPCQMLGKYIHDRTNSYLFFISSQIFHDCKNWYPIYEHKKLVLWWDMSL